MQDPEITFTDKPATIALLGTTDKRNKWRDPIIRAMVGLGVEESDIYNPVISDREWDPVIDSAAEAFQKKYAKYLFFYIGNTGSGKISTYTSFEVAHTTPQREINSVAVILDATGIDPHPANQLEAIRTDLTLTFPELSILDTMGESLAWITNRLGLQGALGNLALRLLSTPGDTHLAPIEVTPQIVEELTAKEVRNLAIPIINHLSNTVLRDPYQKHYYLDLDHMEIYGLPLVRDRLKSPLIDFIATHFSELGWDCSRARERYRLQICPQSSLAPTAQ